MSTPSNKEGGADHKKDRENVIFLVNSASEKMERYVVLQSFTRESLRSFTRSYSGSHGLYHRCRVVTLVEGN